MQPGETHKGMASLCVYLTLVLSLSFSIHCWCVQPFRRNGPPRILKPASWWLLRIKVFSHCPSSLNHALSIIVCVMHSPFIGFSSKSELFDSLRVYLDNKNRLQPIIGLGSIIECVKAGAHIREAFYMCEVCVCRLSKADMRNHIIGSLHRYNYIKTWYPHVVSEWKDNSDLSKLAWPLMDIAKILEGKEGPGDIQLLEVDDDVYQKIASYSENAAITFISNLRDGLGDCESESPPVAAANQSQRIVLLAQNSQRQSEISSMNDMTTHNQVLSEPYGLPGRNCCFFDGYKETKPLIGLNRVRECRSEDGRTYCFLCHCCRTRANKGGITDHLTSSSHIFNYLMETHPEQVKFIKAADNYSDFLQSLAEKVENEEGRGEPKVVNAPEPICVQMTNRSYNWCIKMLFKNSPHNNSLQKKVAVKGESVNTTSVQGMPAKLAVAPLKWAQKMTTTTKKNKKKKKKKKEVEITNTVFNVSLPLTKGAVLLERTSFSMDRLPFSWEHSPSSADEPSSEFQTEDSKSDSDSKWFAGNYTAHTTACESSQFLNNDEDAGQHVGSEENFTVSPHQRVDDYFCANDQNPYNPSYTCKEGYAQQGYNAVAQSRGSTGADVSNQNRQTEMRTGSDPNWHHYQQQHQPIVQDHASVTEWPTMPHGIGHHGPSGELVPSFNPARISMYPYSTACYPHSASTAPEPRTQFHEIEQGQSQTYVELSVGPVQTAPHNYMMHPTLCQAVQVGHGVLRDPNYNIQPRTDGNPPFPLPFPVSGGNGFGAIFQSNVHMLPEQAPYYGAQSDGTYRAIGFSGVTSSGGDSGTAQLIHCNSQFNFRI